MISQEELIREVSRDSGYTQKSIREILDTLEYRLVLHARKDEKVRMLKGFILYPGYHESRNYVMSWMNKSGTAGPHFTPYVKITGAFREKVNKND